jgi:DNA polymerase III subunit delta'
VPLSPLYGHDELRTRLAGTLAARKLPPALLLIGPAGVGKQRVAHWIAAGLLCETGPGAPCGRCQSCRLVNSLQHPDVHWYFPVARPKGDEAKQVEEAEELLGEAVAVRRENPLYGRPDGLHGLFLPLVRLLHRQAMMRPVMGRAKVFIVGDADRLVPQASSPEAANAMLKVLEEPPPDTHFVLTTTEPASLLPTIRSRLVPLRVRRVPAAEVARFLREVPEPPLPADEAARRAEASLGSIGDALEQREDGAEAAAAASRLLDMARKGAAARYRYALGVKAFGARSDFSGTLDAAAEALRDELAQRLRGAAGDAHPEVPAERLLDAIRELDRAKAWARGNVNPQLIVAHLGRALAELGL